MEVLVGIPTHKRAALLRECLDSVAAQTGELPSVRVFVADNDALGREGILVVQSLAGSYRFPISAICVDEPGISAVRNAILTEARRGGSDFLAMIDDDETAGPNWLAALLAAQAEYQADVVGGPVVFDLQGDRSFEGAMWADTRPTGRTELIYATNNVLVSIAALKEMDWPLFDPQFGLTGGGDLEWFTRIKKAGARFAWTTSAIVSEVVPSERRKLGWFLKRQFRVGENQIRIARLHGDVGEVFVLLVKAAGIVVLAPLLALRSAVPARRNELLRKLARVAGLVGGVFGIRHEEYAERHRDVRHHP